MTGSDRHKWDRKFSRRGSELLAPDGFIMGRLCAQPAGALLDVACGDGRNAIHLARLGWRVTALDISPVALGRLSAFAAAENLDVATIECDLESVDVALPAEPFDAVIVCHYKPPMWLLERLCTGFAPGGRLLLSIFNELQHECTGINRGYCVAVGELKMLPEKAPVRLVEYRRTVDRERHLDGYVFEADPA